MKVELEETKEGFKPVSVKITLESPKEVSILYALINTASGPHFNYLNSRHGDELDFHEGDFKNFINDMYSVIQDIKE